MLKHVQISPLRNRADSVSLRSSISCASSLCGSPEPPADLLRPVSRASSYCSLSESQPQTTIKIYTACLRIDIEYKTLGIQWDTTSKEVVAQLLRRCKLRQRDPRLFYLSMEVTVRRAGVKTLLALDDAARPATLQACHPKGDSRFCLQMKPGGLIKVHTSVLQATSQYKSLLIAEQTTSDELLQLLLASYNSSEPVEQFSLYEVCAGQEYQRKLHPDDQPLRAQLQRTQRGEQCHFLVRKNPHYPRRKHILAPIIETTTSCHSLSSTTSSAPPPSPSLASTNGSDAHPSTPTTSSVCKMCKNTFRSCEFCHTTIAPSTTAATNTTTSTTTTTTAAHSRPQLRRQLLSPTHHRHYTHGAGIARHSICAGNRSDYMLPPVVTMHTDYSPVYNVREIRSVCHSFAALAIDKKPTSTAAMASPPQPSQQNHHNDGNNNAEVTLRSHGVATPTVTASVACPTQAANTSATINRGSVVMEAVHNDPANGYGKFVYI